MAMSWDPFREMESLRREIDRVFDNMTSGGSTRWSLPFSRFSFLPGRSARAYPLLNLSEDEEHVYVEALAPGVDPQTLKVSIIRGQLVIAGEKLSPLEGVKPEAVHRNERAAGKFMRTIDLPAPVNEGEVKAEYKDGLLRITLPKAEEAKPRTISVNVG